MQKRQPGGAGVDLLRGDYASPTTTRPILKATPLMEMRLRAKLWGGWLSLGGPRP